MTVPACKGRTNEHKKLHATHTACRQEAQPVKLTNHITWEIKVKDNTEGKVTKLPTTTGSSMQYKGTSDSVLRLHPYR